MRDQTPILLLVCAALAAAPSIALAEEAEPPPSEASAPDEGFSVDPSLPEPAPPTPRPQPEVVRVETLACAAVECRCVADAERPCAEMSCGCTPPGPADRQELPARVRSTRAPTEPSQPPSPPSPEPTVQVRARPPLPAALDRPAPSAGFLTTRRVAARFDFGFPFLEVEVSFRAHDVVHLALGYRSLYATLHGGYGAVRLRLYRNAQSTRGLSLLLLGGMSYSRERYFDNFTGANGFFGDVALAFSTRRRIHAFDLIAGLRLAWMRGEVCEESSYSSHIYCDGVFDDGRAGLLPTVFVDLGYTVRISPTVSYFLAGGVHVYTTSDDIAALPRFRNGFIVEL